MSEEEKETKDPMSPEKIKQHEPTAVKRDPSEQEIVSPGEARRNHEEAREIARKKGMAKGTRRRSNRRRVRAGRCWNKQVTHISYFSITSYKKFLAAKEG